MEMSEVSGERRDLCITEYDFSGKRRIAFDRGVDYDAECSDVNWEYAYVTEYRS